MKIGTHSVFGIVVKIMLIVALGFGLLQFVKYTKNTADNASNQSTTASSTTSTTTVDKNGGTASVITAVNSPKRTGTLPTAQPLIASKTVRMSVIQLAPSGMYLYVFDTDGINHQLIYKELKTGLIQVGFNPSAAELKEQVEAYILDVFQKHKVTNTRYVQFIVSSGAASIDEISKAIKVLESKYVVTKTTIDQEGAWALAATLTAAQRNNSFVVDVTPTVTRLSWYGDDGKPKTIPLTGSMYSIDNAGKPKISDDQAKAAVADKLRELPESRRQNGIIIWAAADELKQGSKERYQFLQDSYTADKQVLLNGLNILYTVQNQTGTPLVFDFETSQAIGFGQAMK